ncbi:histone H1, gonadal-like isoform X1 [Danaus plexippus]|uniref:histone H1, gonadal-like isoform X1 n=1 Tax=Danaus plexippus TaxID=13037 RepID=UPI002AAF5AB3|nr:histone H1, gonadal-like isoform X1 [Danaus plexippus]
MTAMARITRKALDIALATSKALKPALGIAWQYAKTEVVPPLTVNFFNGPSGKKLEEVASKLADSVIRNIDNVIKDIEAEKAREIKRKIAEAKAAQEKMKAEAERKAEEARKKEEEKLAKEAKAKQNEAAKKVEIEKPATKPEPKPKPARKPKKRSPKKSK